MNQEQVRADVTIIGGGLAGVCAAIAAARNGAHVSLIGNRPVLGGNSSSEVRVWVVGATAHGYNHNAREGGIMGELFVENQYRNPEGNPYLWDALILDKVHSEANISLYLNTDVRLVEASGPTERRTITSVTGWTMGSERLIEFQSPVFIDATGDGLVGFLAGADYRIGRESKEEFGEAWAPPVSDDVTLGSTLLFYTKDTGEPVRFVPPLFAKDISKTSIPQNRIIRAGDNGCAYWWIEFGGELDTVQQNEEIRDELWSVIYGIWDYIKNSGQFDAETMTLEWVGSLPGKREYRRFLGDYVLTQNDILVQQDFADQVAFGGWSIDLHPPGGMYADDDGAKQRYADGVYSIPYRSLYSRNVQNMLMAGRNISASHVAFGSTRVMATCASIGQAVGTAAALIVASSTTPRELDPARLQQQLLHDDGSVFGLVEDSVQDLAKSARVSASSSLRTLSLVHSGEPWLLANDAAIIFPTPSEGTVTVAINALATTELSYTVHATDSGQNYVPGLVLHRGSVALEAGAGQKVLLSAPWTAKTPSNMVIVFRANDQIELQLGAQRPPGTFSFSRKELLAKHERPQKLREWSDREFLGRGYSFSVDASRYFGPDQAVNGLLRPFSGPNMWVSAPYSADAAPWIQLDWPDQVTFSEIDLIFDDDVNEDLINLHHHRTPFAIMPTLVRDYRIEIGTDSGAALVVKKIDNRQRRVRHRFEAPLTTAQVRLICESSNGSDHAHLVAVRIRP